MKKAKTIFVKNKSDQNNVQTGYFSNFNVGQDNQNVSVNITSKDFYRLYINGKFVYHGPARAAHGYARIDRININGYVQKGDNTIAIEVAVYNLKVFYITDEPGFVAAEVMADGNILTATGIASGWCGLLLSQRRQISEVFSHTRGHNEVYDLDEAYYGWRIGNFGNMVSQPLEEVYSRKYLERGVLDPSFAIDDKARLLMAGDVVIIPDKQAPLWFEASAYKNFVRIDGAEAPARECASEKLGVTGDITTFDYDFGSLASAFPCIHFTAMEAGSIDIIHTDRLTEDGDIYSLSGGTNNAIRIYFTPGEYSFEGFEPHSFRYVRIVIRSDGISNAKPYRREYQYQDNLQCSFLSSDSDFNRIFDAARNTLIANTLDVFMDCPGRERAGWLCDSYFTAKSERMMLGDSHVNRAMLEDQLLAPELPGASKGFFNQAYPSKNDGNTIPNWGMFLVPQLYDYYKATNDRAFIDSYKDRIIELMDTLLAHENKFELLENLPGYVFMDWSLANDDLYKKPISVSTNALYGRILDLAADLYSRCEWSDKASRIRNVLKKHAFVSNSFADSLEINKDGNLVATPFTSEANQYYCYWFDVGTKEEHSEALKILLEEHGPKPERYPSNLRLGMSNVFIGLYIRLELLSILGEHVKLKEEMKKLFLYMIENGPGTLWENLSNGASVCHGFASYAGVIILKDFLGLNIPDEVDKKMLIAPNICGLKWARGSMPCKDGNASVYWRKDNDSFKLQCTLPVGFNVEIHIPKEVRGWKKVTLNGVAVEFGKFILATNSSFELIIKE